MDTVGDDLFEEEQQTHNNNKSQTGDDTAGPDAYDMTFDSLKDPAAPAHEPAGKKKGLLERVEHCVFGIMRRRRKPAQEPIHPDATTEPKRHAEDAPAETSQFVASSPDRIPPTAKKQKLSFFDASNIFAKILSRSLYLVILCSGVFMISSELPTHPNLVIGLVLVAVGANVLSKES